MVLEFSNINKISSLCQAQNNFLVKDKGMIGLRSMVFMTMMWHFMLVLQIGYCFVVIVMIMRNNSMCQQDDVGQKYKDNRCYFFHH